MKSVHCTQAHLNGKQQCCDFCLFYTAPAAVVTGFPCGMGCMNSSSAISRVK